MTCKHCNKKLEATVFNDKDMYIHIWSNKFHCRQDKGVWTGTRAEPYSKEELVQLLLGKIDEKG